MIRKIKKTMRLAKMIMDFENVSFFRALTEAREEIKDYEEQIEFENKANRKEKNHEHIRFVSVTERAQR